MLSQCLIGKKKYPELPEFVPLVLSVCQSFYCDHLFRDLSLSSNTWLQAKNWHTRKQIWFKDTLKLQKWGKSLSGFGVLFSTVCLSESLGIWVSLRYLGEGLRIALSWDPIFLPEMLFFSTRPSVCGVVLAGSGVKQSPCTHLGSNVVAQLFI